MHGIVPVVCEAMLAFRGGRVSAIVFALSCGGPSTATEGPQSEGSTEETVSATMHGHLALIGEMQAAVIHGRLGRCQERAAELGDRLNDARHPASWGQHLDELRGALRAAHTAETVDAAAKATARAGYACGSCHADHGVQALDPGAEPPEGQPGSLTETMWRHLWAADRLWAGLIAPSDEAWNAGGEALANSRFVPWEDADDPEVTRDMIRLADLLNIIGFEAKITTGPKRASLYGTFLGACASCHEQYASVDRRH